MRTRVAVAVSVVVASTLLGSPAARATESCTAVGPSAVVCDMVVTGVTHVDARTLEYQITIYRDGAPTRYAGGGGPGVLLNGYSFDLATLAGDRVVAVAELPGTVTITG